MSEVTKFNCQRIAHEKSLEEKQKLEGITQRAGAWVTVSNFCNQLGATNRHSAGIINIISFIQDLFDRANRSSDDIQKIRVQAEEERKAMVLRAQLNTDFIDGHAKFKDGDWVYDKIAKQVSLVTDEPYRVIPYINESYVLFANSNSNIRFATNKEVKEYLKETFTRVRDEHAKQLASVAKNIQLPNISENKTVFKDRDWVWDEFSKCPILVTDECEQITTFMETTVKTANANNRFERHATKKEITDFIINRSKNGN